MIDNLKLYNADCIDIMKQYPDKYFDLAIVDPIYGHNITGGYNSENGWGKKEFWEKASHQWNNIKSDKNYFVELIRISKDQIIWGGNYFIEYLKNTECLLIWDKGQRNFSLADCEIAWTSFDKASRIFNYSRASNNKTIRIHPTQKPVALYTWLLNNYAKPEDRIIDTHGGSMSSVIAWHYFSKGKGEMVCIEKDKKYFESAKKRIEKQTQQLEFQFE